MTDLLFKMLQGEAEEKKQATITTYSNYVTNNCFEKQAMVTRGNLNNAQGCYLIKRAR